MDYDDMVSQLELTVDLRKEREMKRSVLDKHTLSRFWNNVDKTEACWLWTGYLFSSGYGAFYYAAGKQLAHRVSWLIEHGYMPEENVLHKCDNSICVNPAHLFLGNQRDNTLDAIAKGRLKTKITQADADEIRRLVEAGAVQRHVAREYGISPANVCLIVAGLIWKGNK